tara:strand:+ start:1127 stop:1360 length:234 start_codon:yes stop_codon:yes gene_type:complete
MKITQGKLKQIIQEELAKLQEGDEHSRTISQIERIGEEISRVARMSADPAVLERLEMIDDMITDLLAQMQGVGPAPR